MLPRRAHGQSGETPIVGREAKSLLKEQRMKACGLCGIVAAGGLAVFMMGAGQPPSKGDNPVKERMKERMEEHQDDPAVQKYREEFKEELKEHPRIARSLVELHVTKEHLKNAPHDFGGHRVAAIAAIDE